MWYLYLDESGDLGFDFVNKKPSKFFTVTVLVLNSYEADRKLAKEVKKVLARKLNPPKHRHRIVQELKGSSTTLQVKQYFFEQVQDIKFGLYSITINKRKVYQRLVSEKERVYNYIARKVLDQIPFENHGIGSIEFVIDRCKSKPEIQEFNTYIRRQVQSRINPLNPLYINHLDSRQSAGLQACDVFCWGIFQSYERRNRDWLNIFSASKVEYNELYFDK